MKLQKVQTSLFKGLCALTTAVNKLLGNLSSIPSGNEILLEATDAFALIANANLELNQRRRELMKPDLNNDYKHLCSSSSSVTITDQLFGDDLAKEVKELTEVNRVGKKVATNHGSAQRSRYDPRNTRNFSNYDSKRHGNRSRRPFLGYRNNDRQSTNPNQTRKPKQGKPK